MTLIIRNFPLTVQSRGIGVLLRLESVQGTAGYHRLSLLVLLALQGVAPTMISESTRLEESKRRSNQGSGCRSGNERQIWEMFGNNVWEWPQGKLTSCTLFLLEKYLMGWWSNSRGIILYDLYDPWVFNKQFPVIFEPQELIIKYKLFSRYIDFWPDYIVAGFSFRQITYHKIRLYTTWCTLMNTDLFTKVTSNTDNAFLWVQPAAISISCSYYISLEVINDFNKLFPYNITITITTHVNTAFQD